MSSSSSGGMRLHVDLGDADPVRSGDERDVRRMVRLGARIVGRDEYEDVDGQCLPCVQIHWGRQRVVVVLARNGPRHARPVPLPLLLSRRRIPVERDGDLPPAA